MANKVSIVKHEAKTVYESVKKSIDLLGGTKKFIKSGETVVIKPNVLAAKNSETGATASPEIVKSIVKLCYEAGAKKVIIAESSNWGINTMKAFKYCGFEDVVRETGAELFDLKKGNFVINKIDGNVLKKVKIPEIILKADKVINVPVLKVHSMTKITLSLKNVAVGISHDDDKQENLHRIGIFRPLSEELEKSGSFLDHAIADINMVSRSDLVVVDGLVGLQGLGAPLLGRPVNSNLVIAGDNRVAVDAVGSMIMGYKPEEVSHIKLAYEKGLGEINLDNIDIVGEKLENINVLFEPSFDTNLDAIPENFKVVTGCGKCRVCLSTLNYILKRHKEQLETLKTPVTVYVGKKVKVEKPNKERRLFVFYGNCSGDKLYGGGYVPGCPPRSRRQFFQAIGALDLYKEDEGLDSNR